MCNLSQINERNPLFFEHGIRANPGILHLSLTTIFNNWKSLSNPRFVQDYLRLRITSVTKYILRHSENQERRCLKVVHAPPLSHLVTAHAPHVPLQVVGINPTGLVVLVGTSYFYFQGQKSCPVIQLSPRVHSVPARLSHVPPESLAANVNLCDVFSWSFSGGLLSVSDNSQGAEPKSLVSRFP